MKSNTRIALFLSLVVITACTKPNEPSSPPPPPNSGDTLGKWTKAQVFSSTIFDVWFLTPSTGYSVSDAFFKTTDSGKTWSRINSQGFYTDLFFVDGVVGFAKGFTRTEPRSLQTAYTTDGGNTWVEKTLPISGIFKDFFFVSRSTGYITASDGLYKTTDSAKTIQKILPNASNGIYFFNTSTGFVYTNAFQKTNDAGNSWQPGVSLNPTTAIVGINMLQFTDANHGWMSIDTAICTTTNGGITWTKKGFASPIRDIHFINNNVGYVALPSEILKTIDGGTTWTRSCKVTYDNFIEIFFLDEHTGWACSTNGWVYRLKD